MTAPLRKEKEENDLDRNQPLSEPGAGIREAQAREAGVPKEESEEQETLDRPSGERGPQLVSSGATGRDEAVSPRNAGTEDTGDEATTFISHDDLREWQSQWDHLQTNFVDEPRKAVHDADALVSTAIHRVSEILESEHSRLAQHLDGGDSVSTEDMRVALRQYRSFFQRLLTI